MPHDLWCQERVLDSLYDGEHNEHQQHDHPEVLPRVSGLHDGEQDGRHETYQLQIGHHVEQTDKHAQPNGNGEIDDQEANAEEDAHTEGNQRLTTEILVHADLHIMH